MVTQWQCCRKCWTPYLILHPSLTAAHAAHEPLLTSFFIEQSRPSVRKHTHENSTHFPGTDNMDTSPTKRTRWDWWVDCLWWVMNLQPKQRPTHLPVSRIDDGVICGVSSPFLFYSYRGGKLKRLDCKDGKREVGCQDYFVSRKETTTSPTLVLTTFSITETVHHTQTYSYIQAQARGSILHKFNEGIFILIWNT